MDEAVDKLIDKKSKERMDDENQRDVDRIPKDLIIENDLGHNRVYIKYLNGDKEKVSWLRNMDELDVSEYDTSIKDDLMSLRKEVSQVKYESRTYGDLWKVKVQDDKLYIPLPTIDNIHIMTVDEFLDEIDVEEFEPSDYNKLYISKPMEGIDSIYKKTDNGIIRNIKTMYSNFNYKYDKIVDFIKNEEFDLFENYDEDVSSVKSSRRIIRKSVLSIEVFTLMLFTLSILAGMMKLASIIIIYYSIIPILYITFKDDLYYKVSSRIARIKNIPMTIFYYVIDRGYRFKLIY